MILRKPHLLSVRRPAAINRAEGTDTKMKAKRVRDIASLRWYLEGKDLQELATHHQIRADTIRDALQKLAPILYYRCRDREAVGKLPTSLTQFRKNAAFWLEQLNANEDRLLELDNSNLPP